MHLNVPEVFIALILEYLCKQLNLMVIPQVSSDSSDDCAGLLYDQLLQPVLLVQIGVHELLQSFDWKLRLSALLVVL